MRQLLTACLLGACATAAVAQDCAPYPETFAQAFYRSSYAFFNESPQQVSGLVAPPLMSRLQAQRDCWEKHQGCGLRYDPWLGTADGSIAPPLRFERESQEGDRAVVAMRYAGESGQARTVRLKLRKSAANGCWQLEDFVTPLGESLLALLPAVRP
jgi:hypothetical protein